MKLRYFFLALALAVIGIVATAGFRGDHSARPPFEVFPDMNYQDKVKDQLPSAFFADGMASRQPVEGTVAVEMPAKNDYWATGKWDDQSWGDGIPVHEARDGNRGLEINAANMARGRERYTINCAVCHGAVGDGKGITSKYGLNGAASYQTDRLRQMTDGEIFNTISNGKGQMLGYAYNITIDDRWRIIMYIRALQRSQNASLDDASPEEQQQLQGKRKPAGSASNARTTRQKMVVAKMNFDPRAGVDGQMSILFDPMSAYFPTFMLPTTSATLSGGPDNFRPLRKLFSKRSVILSLSKDQTRVAKTQKTENGEKGTFAYGTMGGLSRACLILRQAQDDGRILKARLSRRSQVVRATPDFEASSPANFTP